MSEIELKPCPFCGGEAVIHVSDGVAVICRECGAASKCLVDGHLQGKPDGRAIKSVIKAWNTRKPMERIAEQLEVLREKEYDDSDEESDLTDPDDIYDEGRSQGRYEAFRNAIEIVQKGGAE